MTLPDRRPAALPIRCGLAAVGCIAVLAGCSAAAGQVRLPPKSAAPPTAAAAAGVRHGSVALAAGQRVAAALDGYATALSQAEESGNARQARQLLRPYLAGNRIAGVVRAVSAIWASGDRFYGHDVPHILSVRITGRHAFVHECDDTAGLGLADSATGQTVPGSAGVSDANLVTRLDLIGSHWLVESQLPEDLPCAP